MKRIIVLIALTFLAIACKKDRTIVFTGRVINAVTGEGIAGVQMELVETRGVSIEDPLQTDLDIVQEVTSDANGDFNITYTGWNRYGYYILTHLNTNTHKMIGWQNGGDEIKEVELETFQDNLEIVPYTYQNFSVKNIDCFDESDSMRFNRIYLLTGETINWSSPRMGCYDWFVYKNGVRTDSSRVFNVIEGDSTEVFIHY